MNCVIVGAGGHGRVVLDILLHQGIHQVVGFLDSDRRLHGRRIDGVPVRGSLDDISRLAAEGIGGAVIAIGENPTRAHFARRIADADLELLNAVHPSAQIANNVILGRGVVVAAGAVVCAHCRIADAVILNTGCIVDHETAIGEACHICPGVRIAGRVTVAPGAFIGIGATVIQRVRIGRDAVVGAGAVVLSDVADRTTVVGLPARPVHDAVVSAGD